MTSFELQAIAAAGGGIIVDAGRFSAAELKAIALKLSAPMVIRNATKLGATECQLIAKLSPGKVSFDFS